MAPNSGVQQTGFAALRSARQPLTPDVRRRHTLWSAHEIDPN